MDRAYYDYATKSTKLREFAKKLFAGELIFEEASWWIRYQISQSIEVLVGDIIMVSTSCINIKYVGLVLEELKKMIHASSQTR